MADMADRQPLPTNATTTYASLGDDTPQKGADPSPSGSGNDVGSSQLIANATQEIRMGFIRKVPLAYMPDPHLCPSARQPIRADSFLVARPTV